jgi:hypothetical protein
VSWIKTAVEWLRNNKDVLEAIQAIVTVVALVVGGAWTYALTKQYRETAPKLAIKQGVASWALKDGKMLLRVDSILTNTGKVKIEGVKGRMIVQRLLPETAEQAAQYKDGRLFFSCKDRDPHCVSEQGLNLPSTSTKVFEIKDEEGILEPGESLPYWRYLRFDGDVRIVEVYTVIAKPDGSEDWIFDEAFDLEKPSPSQKLEPAGTEPTTPAQQR